MTFETYVKSLQTFKLALIKVAKILSHVPPTLEST